MRILYLDKNDGQRHVYTVYLENIIEEIEIVESISTSSAIEKVTHDSNFDFIMASNSNNESIGDLYTYIREHCPHIPFILLSPDIPEFIPNLTGLKTHNRKNGHIQLPISPAEFRENILKLMSPSYGLQAVPAFQKVRILHFFRYNKVLCNIYLKLSDRKYIKVINANQTYSKDDLEKFRQKDIEYLFIRNDDFNKFQVSLTKAPFLSQDMHNLDAGQLDEILRIGHTMLQELVLNLGVSTEAIQVAEKSVNEIIELSNKQEALDQFLQMMKNRMDYVYDHSFLVATMCCEILRHMHWNTEDKIKKLVMAALFHDITITNPDLAMIQNKNDPHLKDFSSQEVKEYLQHPLTTSILLNGADFVSPEVETIVLQHHETIEGDGFPNGLHHSRISPLSAIFIIAHDFVVKIIQKDFDKSSIDTIIRQLCLRYTEGSFKAPCNALANTFEPITQRPTAKESDAEK